MWNGRHRYICVRLQSRGLLLSLIIARFLLRLDTAAQFLETVVNEAYLM